MIPRRGFITGVAALLAAPAVIRTPGLLMPVRMPLVIGLFPCFMEWQHEGGAWGSAGGMAYDYTAKDAQSRFQARHCPIDARIVLAPLPRRNADA